MANIVDASGAGREAGVRRAAECLQAGQLVVLPTDTVYGLAADAFNPAGTDAIFAAKGRERRFPLPVLVRSQKQLTGLTPAVPDAAELLMAAFWPGPLTLVLAAEPNLQWDLGLSEGTVAVRMPLDDLALEVIRAVGPLAVTSANRSGQPPATTAVAAHEQLGDWVALYLDAGPRGDTAPSTIVDLTRREPHVLREGALAAELVLAVANAEIDPLAASLATSGQDEPGDGFDGRQRHADATTTTPADQAGGQPRPARADAAAGSDRPQAPSEGDPSGAKGGAREPVDRSAAEGGAREPRGPSGAEDGAREPRGPSGAEGDPREPTPGEVPDDEPDVER